MAYTYSTVRDLIKRYEEVKKEMEDTKSGIMSFRHLKPFTHAEIEKDMRAPVRVLFAYYKKCEKEMEEMLSITLVEETEEL